MFFLSNSALAIDSVSREIRANENEVIITDKWNIDEDFAGRSPETWNLFREAKAGVTNLLSEVKAVLEGESLDVVDYKANYEKGQLTLSIHSKVKADNGHPAQLCWLSTWGGFKMDADDPKVRLGRHQAEMLVFRDGTNSILWFPDLGSGEDYIQDFQLFKQVFKADYPFNQRCELTVVNNRGEKTTLYSRDPNAAFASFDFKTIEIMNQSHKFSANDLVSICTSTKIAKGGYYGISIVAQ